MKLIKNDVSWFLSKPGCDAFASLNTLEHRAVFLYSYLKQIAKNAFDEDQVLFRTAFLLADAIKGSSLPYSTYPAIIDPQKNPFVAYLKNAEKFPGKHVVYYVFLSILHGIAAPQNADAWIYDEELEDQDYLAEKLEELGKSFYSGSVSMADADDFTVEESLQTVQLKLIWLFGQP